jgi:hypothetical protein
MRAPDDVAADNKGVDLVGGDLLQDGFQGRDVPMDIVERGDPHLRYPSDHDQVSVLFRAELEDQTHDVAGSTLD